MKPNLYAGVFGQAANGLRMAFIGLLDTIAEFISEDDRMQFLNAARGGMLEASALYETDVTNPHQLLHLERRSVTPEDRQSPTPMFPQREFPLRISRIA